MADQYSPDKIIAALKKLQENWFVEKVRDSIRITEDGVEAYLLVRVINGASLDSVIDRLSTGLRRRFSLITQEITQAFFRMLATITSPKEILICSPWIRLDPSQRSVLSDLIRKGSKVSMIIRPLTSVWQQETPSSWKSQVIDSVRWLVENDVDVVKNADLHTKLYIIDAREQSAAIFGSENLTGAGNIELGVKITDEVLINKLIVYWDEVFGQSVRVAKEDFS